MLRLAASALSVTALLVAAPLATAFPASAEVAFGHPAGKVPALYDNCTKFNKKYRHGVGMPNARDKTKSKTSEPVTNFVRNAKLYKLAMHYNPDLDRDDDRIACESR